MHQFLTGLHVGCPARVPYHFDCDDVSHPCHGLELAEGHITQIASEFVVVQFGTTGMYSNSYPYDQVEVRNDADNGWEPAVPEAPSGMAKR